MNNEILLDTSDGSVWTITLNRPQAMNPITLNMAKRLLQILADAAQDPRARCLIITGAGDCFSAGFDNKEMAGFDPAAMITAFNTRDPLFKAIALHPLPVIAAINGKAFGAGALMAAAADFRIASSTAEFKVTAVNYGSANATWSLPRLVGLSKAKHILMTGRSVSVEEGLAIGLFDEFSDGDVVQCAHRLAAQISSKSPSGIKAIKELTNGTVDHTTEAAWKAEFDYVLDQLKRTGDRGDEIFGTFLKSRKP